MIRQAEPRDLPELKELFGKLCDYLRGCGQWLLTDDPKDFDNGAYLFLLAKMAHEESVVFVSVDVQDVPTGFVIGWLIHYPGFYKYPVVGELQYLYPLSFQVGGPLARAFEKWSKERGATSLSNYQTPGNEKAGKIMERNGRKLAYHHYFKEI